MNKVFAIAVLLVGLTTLGVGVGGWFQFRASATAATADPADYPLLGMIASDLWESKPGAPPIDLGELASNVQSRLFLIGLVGLIFCLMGVFMMLAQSGNKQSPDS